MSDSDLQLGWNETMEKFQTSCSKTPVPHDRPNITWYWSHGNFDDLPWYSHDIHMIFPWYPMNFDMFPHVFVHLSPFFCGPDGQLAEDQTSSTLWPDAGDFSSWTQPSRNGAVNSFVYTYTMENHRKTIGKWWFNGILWLWLCVWYDMIMKWYDILTLWLWYDYVYIYINLYYGCEMLWSCTIII